MSTFVLYIAYGEGSFTNEYQRILLPNGHHAHIRVEAAKSADPSMAFVSAKPRSFEQIMGAIVDPVKVT